VLTLAAPGGPAFKDFFNIWTQLDTTFSVSGRIPLPFGLTRLRTGIGSYNPTETTGKRTEMRVPADETIR